MAYEQRKGALRNLRLIGVSTVALSCLMILEITVFALISGNIGMFISFILASYLLPDVSLALTSLFDQEINHIISFSSSFWISSLAISIIGAIAASSSVLLQASRLSPLETGKKIAWIQKAKSTLRIQAFFCVLLTILAGFLLQLSSSLAAAFVLLATLIVAATLALPVALWAVLDYTLSWKIRNPLYHWFIADTKQQINGLSACLMALLIALSVNIGVNGMIESFRKTFLGWLDQRLVAELYLSVRDPTVAHKIELYLHDPIVVPL